MASENEKDNLASFLSKSMMGGIIGGGGYDFQTRYIVCHFPEWVKDPEFECFVNEATGDVDLRYKRNGKTVRQHIQIKDHNVTPAELRDVIDIFVSIDEKLPNVYQKFILACPSLSDDLRSLDAGIRRIRGVAPFFSDTNQSLEVTRDDLKERFTKVGLLSRYDFVMGKFEFQSGITDFHQDQSALDIFKGRIIDHPKYEERFKNVISHAYALLLQHVISQKGKVVDSKKLDLIIDESFREVLRKTEPKIVVNFHNWTLQKYEQPADKELDWSKYFDRANRVTPPADIWKNELVPELESVKQILLRERSERTILFQGQACLSTGLIFGATFPRSGGWIIEFKQPTSDSPWRSDASPDINFQIDKLEQVLAPDGDSIVLLFNVTGSAQEAAIKAIGDLRISSKALICVSPQSTPGSSSIRDENQATAFAQSARDALYEALNRYQVNKTHIFFYGPQALAIFFGQRLTAVKEIQLYEYKDPGYAPSCSFRT